MATQRRIKQFRVVLGVALDCPRYPPGVTGLIAPRRSNAVDDPVQSGVVDRSRTHLAGFGTLYIVHLASSIASRTYVPSMLLFQGDRREQGFELDPFVRTFGDAVVGLADAVEQADGRLVVEVELPD